VSCQPCNAVNSVVYYLHNQPGRIGYEEIHVTLAEDEREALGELTSKGKHKSQKILDALILLRCDEGGFQTKRSTNEEIARVLNTSMRKIDRVKKRFVEEGLDVALNGRKGSRIYAKKASKEERVERREGRILNIK